MNRLLTAFALLIAVLIPTTARADLQGAMQPVQITSSTPTSCQTIVNAHALLAVWNEASAASTITITFYNDTTCTAADAFYQAINLPAATAAGSIQTFPAYTRWLNALSYKLSGTAANYIYILPGV